MGQGWGISLDSSRKRSLIGWSHQSPHSLIQLCLQFYAHLERMKAAKHYGCLMQTICVVRRKMGRDSHGLSSFFFKRPAVNKVKAGHFAEKGHFWSGWIHSPATISGLLWEAGSDPFLVLCRWAMCVCKRSGALEILSGWVWHHLNLLQAISQDAIMYFLHQRTLKENI